MERVTAFAGNLERFTANRYSPSPAKAGYYGCADYPKLTDPKAGLVRPQHRGRISMILHRPDVLRDSDPLPDLVGDTPNKGGIAWVLSWLAHYPFMTVKTPSTPQVGQP